MNRFHEIKVKEIRNLTHDSVEVIFDIPTDLNDLFKFKAGQYITIKKIINNEEIRRSYSLCSDPNTNEIAIGIKKVENGRMSTFLVSKLRVGDMLEIMSPSGNFILNNNKNIIAICAGSGITPILSMIKSKKSVTAKYLKNKL